MLRLPELRGPYRYVWHPVPLTVSKSYLREPPLLLLRAAESLCGDDTIKCPLWITWLRDRAPAAPPAPAGRAGTPSGSDSEPDESCSGARPAEQPCSLLAMARAAGPDELSPLRTPPLSSPFGNSPSREPLWSRAGASSVTQRGGKLSPCQRPVVVKSSVKAPTGVIINRLFCMGFLHLKKLQTFCFQSLSCIFFPLRCNNGSVQYK